MGHDCGGGYGDGVHCIPGCYPDGQQCQQVGHDWNCAWPPSMLADAMRAQLQRDGGASNSHNEIVIDTRSIEAHLPEIVLAFFFESSRERAASARDAFNTAYGLRGEAAVPLVRVQLNAAGGAADPVFTLAS